MRAVRCGPKNPAGFILGGVCLRGQTQVTRFLQRPGWSATYAVPGWANHSFRAALVPTSSTSGGDWGMCDGDMSTSHQLPEHSPHHADEAHDAFDPEPARSLPPDEAPSPLWLPALGAAVLLVGAFLWVATDDDKNPQAPSPGSQASTAEAVAAPSPPTPPQKAARPAARRPSAAASAGRTARPRLRRIPPPAARRDPGQPAK